MLGMNTKEEGVHGMGIAEIWICEKSVPDDIVYTGAMVQYIGILRVDRLGYYLSVYRDRYSNHNPQFGAILEGEQKWQWWMNKMPCYPCDGYLAKRCTGEMPLIKNPSCLVGNFNLPTKYR